MANNGDIAITTESGTVTQSFLYDLGDAVCEIEGVDSLYPVHTTSRIAQTLVTATQKIMNGHKGAEDDIYEQPCIEVRAAENLTDVRLRVCIAVSVDAVAKEVGHQVERVLSQNWKQLENASTRPDLEGVDIEIIAIGW